MTKKEKNDIYFLENIIYHYDNNKSSLNHSNKCSVVLLNVSKESANEIEKENINYRIIETSIEKIEPFHEGQFLFYDENNFKNANSSPIAKGKICINNLYRSILLKKQRKIIKETFIDPNSNIYSYHINVGHGNCSIIVLKNSQKVNLWMVDCSNYDYKNNYQSHINACFEYIQNKFKVKIFIDKFFLTHTHSDHYSGVRRLIEQDIINSNTEIFINLDYAWASTKYNNLLQKMIEKDISTVEPIVTVGNTEIEIWHPHLKTIRGMTTKYTSDDVQIEPKPNNSSVVYYFKFGVKSILFPGDLETTKWDTINNCIPHLKNTDYFIISHHGSFNGHLRNNCPARINISNLSNCVQPCSTQILMGRDGAYPGIYSSQVISDFRNIIYSEKDRNSKPCRFLEIDWQANYFNWDLT